MNRARLVVSSTLFLLSSCFYSSLEAILYAVTIINLPNNNRLIALYDHHTYQGLKDAEQLHKTLQALRDREDSSNRPLYILMESCVNNIYCKEGPSVMSTLQDQFEIEIRLGEKFDYILIEDIETEIRMLDHVIASVFGAKELAYMDNENTICSLRGVSFRQGSVTFNDLFIDFKKQYHRVLKEREKLYLLCNTDEEKEKIKDYTDSLLEDTTFTFRLMQQYLLDKDVSILSNETMYHKTYDWEKELRETIRDKCRSYYTQFFDFNALARIFTLHKQQGSIDIMFIAGGRHCSEIVGEIEWLLKTSLAYILFKKTKAGVEGLPLNILYKVFQDKTPDGIEALCPNCLIL